MAANGQPSGDYLATISFIKQFLLSAYKKLFAYHDQVNNHEQRPNNVSKIDCGRLSP